VEEKYEQHKISLSTRRIITQLIATEHCQKYHPAVVESTHFVRSKDAWSKFIRVRVHGCTFYDFTSILITDRPGASAGFVEKIIALIRLCAIQQGVVLRHTCNNNNNKLLLLPRSSDSNSGSDLPSSLAVVFLNLPQNIALVLTEHTEIK